MTDLGFLRGNAGGPVDPALNQPQPAGSLGFLSGQNTAPSPLEDVDLDAAGDATSIDIPDPEPLPARGFWEVVRGADADRLPFIGTAREFAGVADLVSAARRVQAGNASAGDMRKLDQWMREQQRETTFLGQVADLALDIPKYAGEFFASGGAATAGKESAKFAAKKLLDDVLKKEMAKRAAKSTTGQIIKRQAARALAKDTIRGKVLRGVGEVGLRVGAMEMGGQFAGGLIGLEERGGIISRSAANAALRRANWEKDEFGRFTIAMDEAVPTTVEMLPVGIIDSMIEVGSELVGGKLIAAAKPRIAKVAEAAGVTAIPLSSQVKALQMKVVDRWINKGARRKIRHALEVMEKGGWHGILGEFLEERLVGVGQLGAEAVGFSQDFDGMEALLPGWEQAAVELAAFSVPTVGTAAVVGGVEYRAKRARERLTGPKRNRADAIGAALTRDDLPKDPSGALHLAALLEDRGRVQPSSPLQPIAERTVMTDGVDPEGNPFQHPITKAGAYQQAPSYKQEGGDLIPREIEEYAADQAYLGGEAYAQQNQIDIGFGLYGSTAETVNPENVAEPLAAQAIFDAANDVARNVLADLGATIIRSGRENVENAQDKAIIRESLEDSPSLAREVRDNFIAGVDTRRLVGRMRRSSDIGEMASVLAALVDVQLWRRSPDKGNTKLQRKGEDVWKVEGRAGLDQGAFEELEALGSIVHPVVEKGQEWSRAQQGWQEFLRIWLTADGTSTMPQTNAWFEDVFRARNPEVYNDLADLRELVTRFRFQGSEKRFATQHQDTNNPALRLRKKIEQFTTARGREEMLQRIKEDWVSKNIALRKFSSFLDGYYRDTRKQGVRPSENPELLAEGRAAQSAAMTETFAFVGPMTWTRKMRDEAPLASIGPIIQGAEKDFQDYLGARRTISVGEDVAATLNEEGDVVEFGGGEVSQKESIKSEYRAGISALSDARAKRAILEAKHPQFPAAARIVYEWWQTVEDFVAESSPVMAAFVKRMRARDPGDWMPLHRIQEQIETLEQKGAGAATKALGADVSKPLDGGMLPVEAVLREFMKEAERMFELAFNARVIDSILMHKDVPGIADYFVTLPPDQVVGANPRVSKMLRELQDLLDTKVAEADAKEAREFGERPPTYEGTPSGANLFDTVLGDVRKAGEDPSMFLDEVIEFYKETVHPDGSGRNIVPHVNREGRLEFIEFRDDGLIRWLNDLNTTDAQAMPLFGFMRWHKKMFTLGTTGTRVVFQLIRNPIRDIGTALINTRTHAATHEILFGWFKTLWWETVTSVYNPIAESGLGEKLNLKPKELSDAQKLYLRMGLQFGEELATDSFQARTQAKRLTKAPTTKREKFTMFWDYAMNLLQVPERTTRTNEMMMFAQEMIDQERLGSVDNLSEDAMWDLIMAGKWVSTNFTASGRKGEKWNQITPFFNAGVQGPRDTIRALMDASPEHRKQKILRAISIYTIPGLLLWYFNKDEEWYRGLTVREKAGFWYIPVAGNKDHKLVMPLPFEIGIAFSAIPVAFMDSFYRDDPEGADWFIKDLVDGFTDSAQMAETAIPTIFPATVTLLKEVYSNEKSFWKTPIVNQSLARLEKKAQFDEYTSHFSRWLGKSAGDFGINDGEGWSPKMIDHIVGGLFGRSGADLLRLTGTDGQDTAGLAHMPILGPIFKETHGHHKVINEMYEAYNRRLRRFDTKVDPEDSNERQVRLAMRDAVRAVSGLAVLIRATSGEDRTDLQKLRIKTARSAMRIHAARRVTAEERKAIRELAKEIDKDRAERKAQLAESRRETLQ